jgi:ribonuclease P protein component
MVAKRIIRGAVQRNALRRMIRECFRNHQNKLAGLDVIVMVRCDLSKQSNLHLYETLKQQWQDLIALWENG